MIKLEIGKVYKLTEEYYLDEINRMGKSIFIEFWIGTHWRYIGESKHDSNFDATIVFMVDTLQNNQGYTIGSIITLNREKIEQSNNGVICISDLEEQARNERFSNLPNRFEVLGE